MSASGSGSFPRIRSSSIPSDARDTTKDDLRPSIFVVDDEPAIAALVTRFLSRSMRVVAVTDPRDALHVLLQERARFDVILCDVRMPHVEGPDLYRIVCERRLELARRFLFMTGSAIDPAVRRFLDETGGPQLEKPFSVPRLLEAVEAKLASVRM